MLVKKIIKSLIEGNFIRKTKNKLVKNANRLLKAFDEGIGIITRYIFYFIPKVQPNKIMFMTFRNNFSCNQKYIAEEIIRQGLDYDLVWAVDKESLAKREQFPEQIRLVKRGSFDFYWELASSKIWIDNALNCVWKPLPKKKNQYYLQTWHGSLGIKRIGEKDVKNKNWVRRAKLSAKLTDYCISNSTFETEQVYRGTYWKNTPVLLYGHARNDMFLSDDKEFEFAVRKKINEYFGLVGDEKIALYAPTFRDNKNMDVYNIEYGKLIDALTEKFGGKWIVLARYHYSDRKNTKNDCFIENVYNATTYEDMQELILIADIGITDYSSWIYDYMLMRRPGIIYAVDKLDFDAERGFYYPLETTPFPIATNNYELLISIENFDYEKYQNELERFLLEKGCVEDGKACKRIVEKIQELTR